MNALTLIGTIILWVLAAVGTISVFLMAHGARKYNTTGHPDLVRSLLTTNAHITHAVLMDTLNDGTLTD